MDALCRAGAAEHIHRVPEGSIRELAMILPGALGDFLLALPTLRLLRRRHRAMRTTLVVSGAVRGVARMSMVADEVASLDDASTAWLFGGTTMPPWLARRPAVFSWLGGDASLRDRLAAAAATPCVLGVERGLDAVHATVAYARAAGVEAGWSELAGEARIAPPDSSRAQALVGQLSRPLLVIHRGAGAPAKRWPRDCFAAVADGWRRTTGDVIDLLGPAEAADEALENTVPARDWELGDAAALLGLADAYAGNDSGISHLAAAVGCRGVAIFTSTDPARWAPVGGAVVALEDRAIAHGPAAYSTRSAARVLALLAARESLTSSDPGSSVRAHNEAHPGCSHKLPKP
jgi:heptosyltransferase-3